MAHKGESKDKLNGEERYEPVFVINNHLPAFDQKNFSTSEICTAAEKTCGYNTIDGAQRIGGLWRIYPRSKDIRQKLLLQGIVLRGVAVAVKNRNPYIVHNDDGVGDNFAQQPSSTKLIISNVPLSYSDNDIMQSIKQLGVTLLSKLILERDRDESGKLTHWKTGRRILYVSVPKEPLPKTIQIGAFKAALYHKEQKTAERQAEAECRRCLTKGHKAAQCTAPIKCRQCLEEGHKAGDYVCKMTPAHDDTAKKSDTEERGKNISPPRGRSAHRALNQRTLSEFRRRGSGSVKRKTPPVSTPEQQEKQARTQSTDRNKNNRGNSDDIVGDTVNDSVIEWG